MQNLYHRIFLTTTKYILLRNFFMIITGIVVILVVRLLGPEEYGKYALVWQLVGTVGPILSLGWHSTLAKFLPEKTEQEKEILFSQSLISVSVICLFFFIVGYFVIQFFPKIIPLEIKQIKIVFLFFIILVAFFNIFEGFYRGVGKFNQWTVIDGLKSNLGSILAIILLIVGYRYYQTVIFSNFLFTSIFFVLVLIYLRKHLNFQLSFSLEKQVFNFALIMLFGQISYFFISSVDSVLLRALLKDPTQVGIYNAGIRIPKTIEVMFIGVLPTPFLYYFTSKESSELRGKILEFGSKILAVLFGFVSVILFSFSKEIILLLFGRNYTESITVLQIFSFSLFILAFLILFSVYFQSINKPQIPVIMGIVFFVLVTFFNFLLIPKLKSQAPAISYIFSLLIYAIIILLLMKNSKFFVDFVKICVIELISYLFGIKITKYLVPLIYVVLVFLFKMIHYSEIQKFIKVIKHEI